MSCQHPKSPCPWCDTPLCVRCGYSREADSFSVKPGTIGLCAFCEQGLRLDENLVPQRLDLAELSAAAALEFSLTLAALRRKAPWPRRDSGWDAKRQRKNP